MQLPLMNEYGQSDGVMNTESLHKLENMQKLATFYLSNTKRNIIMVIGKQLQNCKNAEVFVFEDDNYGFLQEVEDNSEMNNLIMRR